MTLSNPSRLHQTRLEASAIQRPWKTLAEAGNQTTQPKREVRNILESSVPSPKENLKVRHPEDCLETMGI